MGGISAGAAWGAVGPFHAVMQVLPVLFKLIVILGGLSGQLL